MKRYRLGHRHINLETNVSSASNCNRISSIFLSVVFTDLTDFSYKFGRPFLYHTDTAQCSFYFKLIVYGFMEINGYCYPLVLEMRTLLTMVVTVHPAVEGFFEAFQCLERIEMNVNENGSLGQF
ncbi:hypothetical protein WA026_017545 [Henosepilachna vigintioctopunctata]|uniref:Uncharacterized protein n=1 Tax=Henosepilachna vigintioctopunctata TaxID=420089 RepID=A0AAW1V2V9_9CUCU